MLILLYHQIQDIPLLHDPLQLAVSPSLFEREMAFLYKNGYECLSLASMVKMHMKGEPLPARAFAITLDDGYQDNFDYAFPILRKYGFTATIFLVPERVGKTTKWWGLTSAQEFPLMPWPNIREMALAGIEFGSHTYSHALLNDLKKDEIDREFSTSKKMIENELDKPVELFAFPYERSTPSLAKEVENQGYLGACGSLLLPESRFNLWRTQCFGTDTMEAFRFKISGLWRHSILMKYHNPLGNGIRSVKRRLKAAFGS
jgi:peptidoglycan/xylan/chitin deacetylase (PgdA/CDA1 family)